jgi:hypothetical protein
MSTEENRALAHRVVEEIYSQGDLSRIDEFLALDMVVHDPGREYRGREQVKQAIARLHAAFPDLRYTVEDMIAERDKVAILAGVMIMGFEIVEVLVVGSDPGLARNLQVFYFTLGLLIAALAAWLWSTGRREARQQ